METITLFKKVRVEPSKRYPKNPILKKGDLGRWNDRGVRDQSLLTDPYGSLIKENGKYILYYNGGKIGGQVSIGRATFERPNTSKIQNVIKYNNNPVLTPRHLRWENKEAVVFVGTVIKRGLNDYIMFFSGSDRIENRKDEIYYALSSDGINWTPNLTPLINTSAINPPGYLTLPDVKKIQYGSNSGKLVMYIEYSSGPTYYATSNHWTSGWRVPTKNNPVIPAIGPWGTQAANTNFIELGKNEYIMGITVGNPRKDVCSFFISTKANSGWKYYGKVILAKDKENSWDSGRLERPMLVKNDIGNNIVGMFYHGCPTSDSFDSCGIGYTTIEQKVLSPI